MALRSIGVQAEPIHDVLDLSCVPTEFESAYCAVTVSSESQSRFVWTPIADLRRSQCLLEPQRAVLNTYLGRLACPDADFDSPQQVDAVNAWTQAALASHGRVLVSQPRVLKHRRHLRVVAWPTTSGDTYLKASSLSVPHEARVTAALSSVFPRHFARSISFCSQHGWWLSDALLGTAYTPEQLTPGVGGLLGSTLARVQRDSLELPAVREAFGSCEVSEVTMLRAGRTAVAIIDRFSARRPELDSLRLESLWRRVAEVCRESSGLPSGVVHRDLCLQNIVINERSLGFVDLEDAHWGPVILPLFRLLSSLSDLDNTDVVRSIVDSYIDEWHGLIERERLEAAINALPVIGPLFRLQTWLDRQGISPSDVVNGRPIGVRQTEVLVGLVQRLLHAVL